MAVHLKEAIRLLHVSFLLFCPPRGKLPGQTVQVERLISLAGGGSKYMGLYVYTTDSFFQRDTMSVYMATGNTIEPPDGLVQALGAPGNSSVEVGMDPRL